MTMGGFSSAYTSGTTNTIKPSTAGGRFFDMDEFGFG
jgi:hypothetical protein